MARQTAKTITGLTLNGTNATVLAPADYIIPQTFSIAFWHKPGVVDTNDRIVDQQDSGPANGFTLNHVTASSPQLTFTIRNSTTNVANITTTQMKKGEWNFVVGTFTENSVKFFVNTIQQGSTDTSATMGVPSARLTIGGRSGGGNLSNASISEFMIFGKVLSDTEIAALHNKTQTPSDIGSCQIYYKFDEGEGTVATDYSGNSRNGTIANGVFITESQTRSTATRSTLTQNYTSNAGVVVDDCETLASWPKTSAGGTVESDATNFIEGTKSLKLTPAEASNVTSDKTISESFANYGTISLWMYVPSLTGLTSVAIYITSATNYSTYFIKTITGASLHEGWNYLSIAKSEFTASGAESWSNTMVRFRLRINASAGTPSVSFDRIYKGEYKRPKVLFTFDDSWDSQYSEAYAYMNNLGMKGTIYAINTKVDTAGYMTTAQLQTVYAAGWDIGLHGATNYAALADQTAVENDVQGCIDFLNARGLTRANRHIAYPNGGYNDTVLAAMTNLGILTGRTIVDRNQANELDENLLITRQGVYNTTGQAATLAFIDRAVSQGNSVWLNYHILVASDADVSTKVLNSDFEATVDYAKSLQDKRLLDVVTVSEWYNGLANPRLTAGTRSAA